MSKIFVQMTPFPSREGLKSKSPETDAFVDEETAAFLKWSGLKERKEIVGGILPGFENDFLLLRSPSDDEGLLDNYSKLRCELSGDVVAGDIGTTWPDGNRFDSRCRWELQSDGWDRYITVLLKAIFIVFLIVFTCILFGRM